MAIKKITNKSSKYYGKYRVRVQPMVHGIKVSVPVQYTTTEQKAKKLEKKLVADARSGFKYAGSNELLTDAFSAWVQHQVDLDRWSTVTEKSWRFTERMVKQYCQGLRINNCNEDTMRKFIHDYVKDRDVTVAAHSSADRLLQQMRTYFLTLEGVSIRKSPIPKKALDFFFRKDRQSIVKDKYVLTDQEFDGFKQLIKHELADLPVNNCVGRLALWIEAETGMRPQEVQALQFEDLTEEEGHWVFKIHDSYSELQQKMNGHLKSRKIGEWRFTPPISKDLYEFIRSFEKEQAKFIEEKQLGNPDHLICLCLADYRLARLSKPISQRSMNDLLKKLCRKVGVNNGNRPLTCYTLRTTTGTRLARLGDYSYASDRLGNSLAVYMRYYVKPLDNGYRNLMDRYLAM